MRLFEIDFAYQSMIDLLDDPDIDDQAWCDTLDALEGELEDKAIGYAAVSKAMDGEIEILNKQIELMKHQVSSIKKRQDHLKGSLYGTMKTAGLQKVDKDPRFKISIRKNGGVLPMWVSEDMNDIPQEFIKHEPKVDTKAIRQYLDDGNKVEWAHFNERGESLIIK